MKQVDVLCRHEESGELLGVEIALSSPDQEIENAVQNLLGATPVDRLIIACRDRNMLERIERRLAEHSELQLVREKIELTLVGRYFQ